MQQLTFGFNITISTGLDLTGATSLKFRITKPDLVTVFERTIAPGNIVGEPTLGVAYWPVQAGDLDQSGPYQIQLIDLTPGRIQFSRVGRFEVWPNLTPPLGISP